MSITTLERFEGFFTKSDDDSCWEWQGGLSNGGYGRFGIDDKTKVQAHRFSYEIFTGNKIPKNFDIHHVCENPLCVNPKHLKPLSRSDHNKTKNMYNPKSFVTHCIRGHEFTIENTYITKEGRRSCRKCHNDRRRKTK